MSKKLKALKKALFPTKYLKREIEKMSAQLATQEHEINALKKELRALRHVLPFDKNAFAELIRPMSPHRAQGVGKIRMGSEGDGGYVMLNDFKGTEAAYSLGIGSDVSWDLALACLGLPIFQFDHTVEKPPLLHELFHFHRQKIGPQPDPPGQTVTINQLLREKGHLGKNLILKMDIDGAEWEVLDQMDDDLFKTFRQIVCEMHDLNRFIEPAWYARAGRVIKKLTRHHKLVHIHGNNYVPPFWNGFSDFPDVLEATFALSSAYDLIESDETYPGPLDRPNARGTPDFQLGNFRFEVKPQGRP